MDKTKNQKRLEVLLLEGLESGKPVKVTAEYLNRRRRELRARFKPRSDAVKTL